MSSKGPKGRQREDLAGEGVDAAFRDRSEPEANTPAQRNQFGLKDGLDSSFTGEEKNQEVR
jgi:hypothetical protein